MHIPTADPAPEQEPTASDGRRSKEQRLTAIVQQLAMRGSLEVSDLVQQLQVSAATVRRDLEELEDRHLLERTHGGAVRRGVTYELPLRYKTATHHEEKLRIGAAAARLVGEDAVVGLTGGTTCTETARALVERSLTVVTNALNIAWELAVHPEIKLVVAGGVARSQSYELVGPLAEQALATLNLDLVFLGVDGVSVSHGLTTHNEAEAHTNRVLIERAQRVAVVADHWKLGQVRFAQICPISAVHQLITDRGADPAVVEELRSAGLEVQLV